MREPIFEIFFLSRDNQNFVKWKISPMFWVFVKNVNFIKLQKNILILIFMPSKNSERKTELWIYEEMQAATE
jgi:hypothetical protein